MEKETKAPVKNAEGTEPKESIFNRIKTFFKGVKAEFQKIIWPSRDDLTKETIAAVSVSVVLCLIIAIIDALVRSGVGLLV